MSIMISKEIVCEALKVSRTSFILFPPPTPSCPNPETLTKESIINQSAHAQIVVNTFNKAFSESDHVSAERVLDISCDLMCLYKKSDVVRIMNESFLHRLSMTIGGFAEARDAYSRKIFGDYALIPNKVRYNPD